MELQPIRDLASQSSMLAFADAGLISEAPQLVCPHCKASFSHVKASQCKAHIALCKSNPNHGTVNLRPAYDSENRDLTLWGESYRTVMRRSLCLPSEQTYTDGLRLTELSTY